MVTFRNMAGSRNDKIQAYDVTAKSREHSDMEVITQEIERALDAGLYYLALVCTLTLPDICAALESPTGDTSGKSGEKYKKWCATWLEPYP